jgi:hypothetical protein
MNFWVRNLILGVVLAALAYFLFENQDILFSLDEQFTQEETIPLQTDSTTIKVEKKRPRAKPNNAAAEGLSKFYASINPEMNDKGPKIKNSVVYLPDPEPIIKLKALLEARRMVVRPYKKGWKGSTFSRPFRKGETLFQKLSEYGEGEGIEVIWWLNRDLIIKSPFRIEKNILDTAFQIGRGIEGHIMNGVSTYFCYRHRAIVLVEEQIEYLNDECKLLEQKPRF